MKQHHPLLHAYLKNWLAQTAHEKLSRKAMIHASEAIESFMHENNIDSLWSTPTTLCTATLDDALGQGLDIIEIFSRVLGMTVKRIGLLCHVDDIITTCQLLQPDYLGMTVLQFDSEIDMKRISVALPQKTCFVAGGPLFQIESDFAIRCNIDFAARDILAYIEFLIKQ